MEQVINLINPGAFIDAYIQFDPEKDYFFELSNKDFQMAEFKTNPLPGFKLEFEFPYCCEYHRRTMENCLNDFIRFPGCCENHKKLEKAPWFKKSNFYYIPIKCMLTHVYTCHCITTCIDQNDWYEAITEYIDYTLSSYGQLPEGYGAPVGLGRYIDDLKFYLNNIAKIPKEKKSKLLLHIQNEGAHDKLNKPDLRAVVSCYKEWLSIFPFQLYVFKNIKPYFENQMPVLKGPKKSNRYTGLVGMQIMEVKDMQNFLVKTTKNMIKAINALELHKTNQLGDTDQIALDILLADRELELKKYDDTLSQDSLQYRSLLADWLKAEDVFITKLKPILEKANAKINNFIKDVLDGMIELEKQDEATECIRNIKQGVAEREGDFRHWFKTFFAGRYPEAVIDAEPLKGNGRIDLKISNVFFGEKTIEFKGWWNSDKAELPKQTLGYLTSLSATGYIILVNPNKKKDIVDDYRKLICTPEMHFIPNTWIVHTFPGIEMSYYESGHQFGVSIKKLVHFVYNVYS
ncbi:hypothetical protein LZZ85_13230 [Terrimonas sp. NA20]|uniref:DUF2357 domain-containing protein n=1 Tax=Terrimonas ginsenosidimutans TaxID=2908004 RepID=A0ABS9KSJ3_9BACT|nr:hypothetical protein [Terrimonas ginsenosidimutans]MCG2615257.1 hypothetical protein [Terrimonas ginsenosidimutans]